MKKTITLLLAIVITIITSQQAQAKSFGPEGKKFGLGIVAGDPTGLTAKAYLSPKLAIDGIVSWSFIDEAFTIIGDATYQFFDIPTNSTTITWPFYAGVGAKFGFDQGGNNDGDTIFGLRIPVGVAAHWNNHPFEVFLEVSPGIELAPETELDVTGGLGVRYYF